MYSYQYWKSTARLNGFALEYQEDGVEYMATAVLMDTGHPRTDQYFDKFVTYKDGKWLGWYCMSSAPMDIHAAISVGEADSIEEMAERLQAFYEMSR